MQGCPAEQFCDLKHQDRISNEKEREGEKKTDTAITSIAGGSEALVPFMSEHYCRTAKKKKGRETDHGIQLHCFYTTSAHPSLTVMLWGEEAGCLGADG